MADQIDVYNQTWLDRAYNAGCMKRRHSAGIEIVMLLDKPGVFYSANGQEVDVELATEAGFNTETLLKQKLRQDRIAEAAARIDEELKQDKGREIVADVNGLKVVHLSGERHQIMDEDGAILTPHNFLSLEEAKRIAAKMKPAKKAAPKAEAHAAKERQSGEDAAPGPAGE